MPTKVLDELKSAVVLRPRLFRALAQNQPEPSPMVVAIHARPRLWAIPRPDGRAHHRKDPQSLTSLSMFGTVSASHPRAH